MRTYTNNDIDTAPTIEAAESTKLFKEEEIVMDNTTTTERAIITSVTNIESEVVDLETKVIGTVGKTMTIPQRVHNSKSTNPWVQRISLPSEAEIKEIRETRRCELVTEFQEKIASNIIDKHTISSDMEFVVADGTKMRICEMIAWNNKTETQDIIEPNTGNDIAVLKHRYLFDATYSTPLRGKEVYSIAFTVPSIKYILSYIAINSWKNTSKIKVIEALNENIILSNLNEEDIKIYNAPFFQDH